MKNKLKNSILSIAIILCLLSVARVETLPLQLPDWASKQLSTYCLQIGCNAENVTVLQKGTDYIVVSFWGCESERKVKMDKVGGVDVLVSTEWPKQ